MRPWPMPAGVVAAWLVLGGVAAAGPPSEVVRNSLMAVNRLLDDPGLQEKSTELLAAIHTANGERGRRPSATSSSASLRTSSSGPTSCEWPHA